MDMLFHSDQISFTKRVFKGLLIRLIVIWTFLMIWFFTIMPDNQNQISFIVFSILTVYLTISIIPKLRYFLLSIEHTDKSFKINFMDYNQVKQVLIEKDELNIELKYVRERSITYKLLFYNENKLLFTIFAKKQNKNYNNLSFKVLYDTILKLKPRMAV